jgi:hypothetical protein
MAGTATENWSATGRVSAERTKEPEGSWSRIWRDVGECIRAEAANASCEPAATGWLGFSLDAESVSALAGWPEISPDG